MKKQLESPVTGKPDKQPSLQEIGEHIDIDPQYGVLKCGAGLERSLVKLLLYKEIYAERIKDILTQRSTLSPEGERRKQTDTTPLSKSLETHLTAGSPDLYLPLPSQEHADEISVDNLTRVLRKLATITGFKEFGLTVHGVEQGLKRLIQPLGYTVNRRSHVTVDQLQDSLKQQLPVPVLYMVDSALNPRRAGEDVGDNTGLHYALVYKVSEEAVHLINPFGMIETCSPTEFLARRGLAERYITDSTTRRAKHTGLAKPHTAFFLGKTE